jgi:CBS domain-containing protein
MLPETDEQGACAWAERLRAKVAAMAVPIGDASLNVAVSLGAAQRLDDTPACETLIDHADQALLVAKKSGRNRVVSFASLDDRGEMDVSDRDDPFSGVLARDIMSSPVPCLRQVESVGQAAEFFFRFRINSAPVVDEQGKLVGVLSERDVMSIMLTANSWQHPVRDIMKSHVVSYDERAPARTIYEFLCRVSLRRVVIVDDGRPTGVIGRRNLVRWFHYWLQATGRQPVRARSALAGLDRRRARGRMDEAATALVTRAESLRSKMADRDNDLVPLVVDQTTRMQELLGDLLALTNLAAGNQGETQPHLPTM